MTQQNELYRHRVQFSSQGLFFFRRKVHLATPQMLFHSLCVSDNRNSEGNIHPSHWSLNRSSVSVCLRGSRDFSTLRTDRLSLAPADPSAKTQKTHEKHAETARSLNAPCILLVFGGIVFPRRVASMFYFLFLFTVFSIFRRILALV